MPDLKTLIREVPDFPKPGILFYDITTLLKDKTGFRGVIDGLKERYAGRSGRRAGHRSARIHLRSRPGVCARRGFRPGAQAEKTAGGLCHVTYDLEYGTDTLEIHRTRVAKGDRVLIMDDLLATGGTAAAAAPHGAG